MPFRIVFKISASNVGIGHISGNQQSITLEFTQLDKADTQKLVALIAKRAPIVQPLPNNRIKFYFKNSPMSILERISYITEFIKMIRSFETN